MHQAGWDIYILSPNEINSIHQDLRNAMIDENLIKEIINRMDKGQACIEYGISIFLDDQDNYLNEVRYLSTETMPLKIWPHKIRG